MSDLNKLLEECLNEELLQIIISNPRDKEQGIKVKIRPVMIKEKLYFQASEYVGTKIYHLNYEKDRMAEKIEEMLGGKYRQLQAETQHSLATVLVSKKGKVTISRKRREVTKVITSLSHNRKKEYILEEGRRVGFLVDLGVMTEEGKIVKARYDKFRQINRFLEFVEDILPQLPKDRQVRIIDFGCGKSYLTFAMYYYLKELKGYDIRVTGLDLKEDVISHCSGLRDKYMFDDLEFLQGDIASYEGTDSVDMVVTLHACDTATDYALAKAVKWGVQVILSVPCCQHELNGQIGNELLEPVLKYGILKERIAALVTDGLRGELLERNGYQVQLLEFIDMEHTPKNILIRAVKDDKTAQNGKSEAPELDSYAACRDFFGVSPTLEKLLEPGNGGL